MLSYHKACVSYQLAVRCHFVLTPDNVNEQRHLTFTCSATNDQASVHVQKPSSSPNTTPDDKSRSSPLISIRRSAGTFAALESATSCTAEPSLSALMRLKTWLSSTMTQRRLNAITVCHCHTHQEVLDSLSVTEIAKLFDHSDIRCNVFSRWD